MICCDAEAFCSMLMMTGVVMLRRFVANDLMMTGVVMLRRFVANDAAPFVAKDAAGEVEGKCTGANAAAGAPCATDQPGAGAADVTRGRAIRQEPREPKW